MDNLQFGAFVAQLRKERGMTQKELADKLNVTDKAVSKWETGKGFPDLKLLEPLAQALGVSLVELMQGQRQQSETLTVAQAETVVAQAMGQSEKATARRYLKLFRFTLIGLSVFFGLSFPHSLLLYIALIGFSGEAGIIGGADGPTSILVSSSAEPSWLTFGLPAILLIVCIVLALRVWTVERTLK